MSVGLNNGIVGGALLGVKVGDGDPLDGSSHGVKVGDGGPLGTKDDVGDPQGRTLALLAVCSLLVIGTNLSKYFLHSCCKWINRFGIFDNSDGSKCTLNLPNLFFAGCG